jgi:hypothetical protein
MCAGTLILSTLQIGMHECPPPPVAGCLSPDDLEVSDAGSGVSDFRKQLPQKGYISCRRCSGYGTLPEYLNLAMETGTDDGHSDYWL